MLYVYQMDSEKKLIWVVQSMWWYWAAPRYTFKTHSKLNCCQFKTVLFDMIRFIRYKICITTYKATIVQVLTIRLSSCLLFQIIECTFCKLSDTIHLIPNNKKGLTFITPNCTINNTKINQTHMLIKNFLTV